MTDNTNSKEALEHELINLKADYARIQSDLDKLEYVRGNVTSAEEQLARLEEEIAAIYKQLERFE